MCMALVELSREDSGQRLPAPAFVAERKAVSVAMERGQEQVQIEEERTVLLGKGPCRSSRTEPCRGTSIW